jgi:hypothetical protein
MLILRNNVSIGDALNHIQPPHATTGVMAFEHQSVPSSTQCCWVQNADVDVSHGKQTHCYIMLTMMLNSRLCISQVQGPNQPNAGRNGMTTCVVIHGM